MPRSARDRAAAATLALVTRRQARRAAGHSFGLTSPLGGDRRPGEAIITML